MAADPIGSAWQKYSWANKHMESVTAALESAGKPNGDSIAFNVNLEPAHGNIAVVRVTKLPNIRTEYGLALGDAIQNYRAALDHLAWGLVKAGSTPKLKHPKRVYFPMATSGKEFRGRISDWLPGVSGDDRAIVRQYQPYCRGERPKAIRRLNALSNTDKHRILIPAIVTLDEVRLQIATNWPLQRLESVTRGKRALKVGTPLLRATLLPVLGTDCQVQVQGQLTCFPSLGYGVHALAALQSIRESVFEILDTFDKRL